MRVAIYAWVSTRDKGQDTKNQPHQLRAFFEQHGTTCKVLTDQESGGRRPRRMQDPTARGLPEEARPSRILARRPLQTRDVLRHTQVLNEWGGRAFKKSHGPNADTIAAMGNLTNTSADAVVDARGLAVCPGFL